MVKRPLGIRVSYLNEEGDEIESELIAAWYEEHGT
jgi:hypothetical protein